MSFLILRMESALENLAATDLCSPEVSRDSGRETGWKETENQSGMYVPVVVQQTLNTPHSADCHILIPKFPPRKRHDILLAYTTDYPLYLLWVHAAACGDDLAANIFRDGCSAVKGEQDGSFELSLCSFGFGFSNVVGKTGPLSKGEMDKVVDLSFVLRNKVYAPQPKDLDQQSPVEGGLSSFMVYPVSL